MMNFMDYTPYIFSGIIFCLIAVVWCAVLDIYFLKLKEWVMPLITTILLTILCIGMISIILIASYK